MTQRSLLVLLHGFTGCGEVWSEIESILRPSIGSICLTLPGHGSKKVHVDAGECSFEGACDFIEATLDRHGIGSTELWGYSMGGRIALHFALSRPERVRRLILESTSPGILDAAERTQRREIDDALASRIETDGVERFVDNWMNQPLFASQKRLPPQKQARGRQLRLLGGAKGLAMALRGFSIGKQEPLHDRLKELCMPVLILAGELDAKYREIGEAMARSIPRSQFRIIAGAGHALHWEQPSATAAAAIEFLNSPA